jgi:ABC-type transport system involved in cytochrome bd biosynthesis fused ATPase/permease subunit
VSELPTSHFDYLWSKKHRKWLAFNTLANLASATGHAGLAWSAGYVVQYLLTQQSYYSPLFLTTIAVAGTFLKGVGQVISAHSQATIATLVGADIRDRVAVGLLDGRRAGGKPHQLATITQAIRWLERSVFIGFFGAWRAGLQLLGLILLLALLTPKLILVACLVLAPFAITLSRLRQQMRSAERQALRNMTALEEQTDLLVRQIELWRTYGSGNKVRLSLLEHATGAAHSLARSAVRSAALSSSNEVLAALFLLVVVVAVWKSWIHIDAAKLVVFLSLFFSAYRPLRDLGDARSARVTGQVAWSELQPWLVSETPLLGSSPTLPTPWVNETIASLELKNFGSKRMAQQVSFTIQPGEIVAVVGETGVGKTSLLRALLGLEKSQGELTYGTLQLHERGVGPEQRPFAWVPQDAAVFAGTLADNLALSGNEPQQAWDVLAKLERDGSPLAFANDVNHRSERGVDETLSGGERARVALARALVTELPILLLDEPSANLDEQSEQRLLQLLQSLKGKRSVLLITHRRAPLAICDRIFSLSFPDEVESNANTERHSAQTMIADKVLS